MTRAPLVLALIAYALLALAARTEDPDAKLCATIPHAEVVRDTYPRHPALYRCVYDGHTIRAWRHTPRGNVLVLDWGVHW